MPIELTPEEVAAVLPSVRQYVNEAYDTDIGDLRARDLLDFVCKEIAPLAYNRGVADAEAFFRARLEDLPATCYEPTQSYWAKTKKKR